MLGVLVANSFVRFVYPCVFWQWGHGSRKYFQFSVEFHTDFWWQGSVTIVFETPTLAVLSLSGSKLCWVDIDFGCFGKLKEERKMKMKWPSLYVSNSFVISSCHGICLFLNVHQPRKINPEKKKIIFLKFTKTKKFFYFFFFLDFFFIPLFFFFFIYFLSFSFIS